jgi:hypothetical protein
MKPAPWTHLDQYRVKVPPYESPLGATFGAFIIPGPHSVDLKVVASTGELDEKYPFDHVSVSTKKRAPFWDEMEFIKRLFFAEDEYAMQLHVPPANHINFHPLCLHIWRPTKEKLPLPDPIMVGPSHTIAPGIKT